MAVILRPDMFNAEDLYVDLTGVVGRALYVKCEGFNFAGSVKLKAAAAMLAAAEEAGTLGPDSVIVESSSGNLGVALSMIAASRGHRFLCVTDARCSTDRRRAMEAYGATVHVIEEPDPEGGFLGARLRYVRRLCAVDRRFVWLNQYENACNWQVHEQVTAPAIARVFPELDVLFVGTGTAGTLMGCARYFRASGRRVAVVAVDAVGSVTFGAPPGPRMIPGLGAGVRPPLLDLAYVDDVVHVAEMESIRTCRRMARAGFLFGGSTGTVTAGALRWLAEYRPDGDAVAVAIAPDLGGHYLETVYNDDWVTTTYGEEGTDMPVAAGRSSAPTGWPA
ncbi:2,3-diaminopropionate biosynthesis protein SbnA [Actinoplanes sp. NPDC049548]|uniref:2,3-diaminopropionate biosynthesis protein SbnA n=1 Tax=Actinoplanes sp. NPDC049548 TaxID=3155152 RepID=UPI00342D6ED4